MLITLDQLKLTVQSVMNRIKLMIPTSISELDNDVGYITQDDIPEFCTQAEIDEMLEANGFVGTIIDDYEVYNKGGGKL